MNFTRRKDISLNEKYDESDVKEGTVSDFNYFVGTVYRDDLDGLVYETTRVVEDNFQRRGNFIVA